MTREKSRRDRGRGGTTGEGKCCRSNGLWIFVSLGLVLEVLGVVLGAVYLNVRAITSSLQNTEILPTYVPVVAVLVTGLLVLLLFCKRWLLLVLVTSMLSVAVSLLCGATSVLMGTHILRPMMHFTHCTLSRDKCHCFSPYNRQDLSLDYSEDALTSYVYEGVRGCAIIQKDLIHVLFAMCAIYVILCVVCGLVAVVGLLAYCAQRFTKPAVQSDSYEEIFTVSQSSSAPQTPDDSEQPATQFLTTSTSHPPPQLIHPPSSAASQFIYSPSDIPLDYHEACRMRQRSHSFSQPHRQSQSFGSTESNAVYASSTLGRDEGRRQAEGKGQGRLKEHRRRARRAVTLANLDHQQLMLIMSLQLRYLQENESDRQFQLNNHKLERQTRRALTPTPRQERTASCLGYSDMDEQPVKLGHCHTPLPHVTYQRPLASSLFTGDYQNTGVTSVVDYENVDSCLAGSQTASLDAVHEGGQKEPLKSAHSCVLRGTSGGVSSVPAANNSSVYSTEPEESAYIVMHGSATSSTQSRRQGEKTPGARANSYENVDNMSACGIPVSSHSLRDPLYENQKETLAARRLKSRADNPRYPASPSHPFDLTRSYSPSTQMSQIDDTHRPARPKSYINAVQGGEDGVCLSDGSQRDDPHSVTSDSTCSYSRQQPSEGHGHSYTMGTALRTSPVSTGPEATDSRTGFSEGGKQVDIYAQPKKKGRAFSATFDSRAAQQRNATHQQLHGATPSLIQNRSTPLPGQERTHKSAFHQVSRPLPPSPYQGRSCDTDLDDPDPLPWATPRKRSLQTPPYSSPPSYQCLVSLRHGSQRSLLSQHSMASSSSHTTADDLDSDLYKQIRKKTVADTNSGQQKLPNGDMQNRYSNRDSQQNSIYHSSSLDHPYPKVTRGGARGHGHAYPGGLDDYYYQSDHVGIHSFPFRKHHPPYSAHSIPHDPLPKQTSQPVSATQPAVVRSYENLDDLFSAPPSQASMCRGGRSGQGQSVSAVKPFHLDGCGLNYEDIFHLASGQEVDSDPETVETVI